MTGSPDRPIPRPARVESTNIALAMEDCVRVCHSNGWYPKSADVLRLVQHKKKVAARNRHLPSGLSQNRIDYIRWLIAHNKLSDQ